MSSGNTTLRNALLPAVDALRGVPGILGLRLFTVTVITQVWSGGRPGLGTPTRAEVGIKVASGTGQVKVVQISQKDIIASGGTYEDIDYMVGPITPPYTGSTLDDDQIAVFNPPVVSGQPLDVIFRIVGPGTGANGVFCKKIGQDVTKNFRYMLRLRRTAESW